MAYVSTINNFNLANARSIGKRYFGQHLDKVLHNINCFDIYIYDSVDKKELDRFVDKWKEFNVILIARTPYKKQESKK